MFAYAGSRRIADRLLAGGMFALVFLTGGCDPELADWLEQHGTGGRIGGTGGRGSGSGGSGGLGGSGGGLGGSGGVVADNPCAFTLCPVGTVCQNQSPSVAICVKVPPPPECGPVCAIACEFGNVLDPKGCPTCRCNPPPPPPDHPCTTVRCMEGTHCEANPVQCVKAPCPPVASCVPDVPPVSCGGIAALRCPGAGVCLDDPRDNCISNRGGADCGGICACEVIALCEPGARFDRSPNVCSCVPPRPKPPVCGPVCTIFCEYGNVLDASGCPTCSCNPQPKAVPCPVSSCAGQPDYVCPDGRMAAPQCMATTRGMCAWTSLICPANEP